jgi:hypothetical protein
VNVACWHHRHKQGRIASETLWVASGNFRLAGHPGGQVFDLAEAEA